MAEAELKPLSLVDSTHRIRWEVTKQEFDNCDFPDSIYSPYHSIEVEGHQSDWYLFMHPKGDDDADRNNTMLYLAVLDDNEGKKYKVRYQFGIETPSNCWPYGDFVKKMYSKEKLDNERVSTFTTTENENGDFDDTWGHKLCTTQEFGEHFVEDKVVVVASFVIYVEGDDYRDHMEVVDDFVHDIRSASSLIRFSDFKIISGKKRFWCHKVILASRSEYFMALFRNDPTKKVLKVDESPGQVTALLNFINKGVIPENIDVEAMDLILMSDMYGLDLLTVACEKSLVNNLTPDNAVETLIIIDKIKHVSKAEHRQKVLTYIKKEAARVVKTDDWKKFVQNYPDLITEILLFLTENNTK